MMPSPILIAGPTGSGKSSLALHLAQQTNGVIVNADSMQVYKELRLITARPSKQEEAQAPHKLYGHKTHNDLYSTGQWLKDVKKVSAELDHNQRLIIVGGTGLYFKALVEGLSPIPDIDPKIREKWHLQSQTSTGAELHTVLRAQDPVMAEKLRSTDRQRISRALEVKESTGKSLAYWQSLKGTPIFPLETTIAIHLDCDRELLYERINERFVQMIKEGGLEEVKALIKLRPKPDAMIMRALGVRELADALAGTCSIEEAIARAQMGSRRYAKRQMTWLRRNMISWNKLLTQDLQRNLCNSLSNIDFLA